MAYTPKPGQFTLFKNDKAGVETRPDYKGDGLALDGTPVWVSAWIKQGQKGKFMSCSMQPKKAREEAPAKSGPGCSGFDDLQEIPF